MALLPLVVFGVLTALQISGPLMGRIRSFQRVIVPGEGTVELGAGDHVIFWEGRSRVGDEVLSASSLDVKCTLVGPDGPVTLSEPSTATKYTLGGYSGQSVFGFSIAASTGAGKHQLSCVAPEQGLAVRTVLAFGRPVAGAIVTVVALALVGFFGSGSAIYVVYRRRKLR